MAYFQQDVEIERTVGMIFHHGLVWYPSQPAPATKNFDFALGEFLSALVAPIGSVAGNDDLGRTIMGAPRPPEKRGRIVDTSSSPRAGGRSSLPSGAGGSERTGQQVDSGRLGGT